MFNNKKDNKESEYDRMEPVTTTSSVVRKSKTSVIGPTLIFRGELSANEDLIIEGQIEGTIAHQEKNLTVGKEGRVKANINARTVEVYGLVEGDIHGEDIVKLAKSANVKGNIHCSRLIMEDGAQFSGNIDMSQAKKTTAIPPSLLVADTDKKSDKKLESAG
jgi:cytoskeletal protein CcmA (bactofilin family)